MCQKIIQFCSGSTKPLVFTGSFVTLLLAILLAYLAHSAQSLYQDIDPAVAQSRSLTYYLQLLASAYLILISALACFAAHYDQKHFIRASAIFSSLNFLLALTAILMITSGSPIESGYDIAGRLQDAIKEYDFKLKPEVAPTQLPLANPLVSNQTSTGKADKQKRMVGETESTQTTPTTSSPLNGTTATKLWDDLQSRGCCGIKNYTDWPTKLPKSCCSEAEESKDKEFTCKSVDEQHKRPCIELISSISFDAKNMNLLLVLALLALINLYLANVTGISAYRTFHYDEASQNAYS